MIVPLHERTQQVHSRQWVASAWFGAGRHEPGPYQASSLLNRQVQVSEAANFDQA